MKATMSLKQLRTDPREYIRLLKSGYEVEITEHRKPVVTAVQPEGQAKPARGNLAEILRIIESLPPIKVLDPELDTVAAGKKAKAEYWDEKYQRILKQQGRDSS